MIEQFKYFHPKILQLDIQKSFVVNLTKHSFVLLASVICFANKHTETGHDLELINIWNCWSNLFNKYFSDFFYLGLNFMQN